MKAAGYELFDPLLPEQGARDLMRLAESFGSYGMYAQEPIREGLGKGLFQRHDVALNFLATGGRFGRRESIAALARRTNYFRETYAYADPVIDGIDGFLHYEPFYEAARRVSGRPVIKPAIVYANILVPGQELGLHTDVPEFRGLNRTKDPEWLMTVMLHSGLFEPWRIPIATAVAWFGQHEGGEFCFYPEGPDGEASVLPASHNTALLTDTDRCFHGVDRVGRDPGTEIPAIEIGMRLDFKGDGKWAVGGADGPVANYGWEDLRFSISWKAYCYADNAERRTAEQHSDDLGPDEVVDRLAADLRERDRLNGDVPGPTDLALLMIEEYVKFPSPAA